MSRRPRPQSRAGGSGGGADDNAATAETRAAAASGIKWNASEIQTRQTLEARLRTNPADRATMIGLATLVATKREYELAQDLLDRATIGITGDDHCASLLRKVAIAHVAIWKAKRNVPDSDVYVNCSTERKKHLGDAVVHFEQALAHPENQESPVALSEMALAKMHRGELKDALADFSHIISNFPKYPKLNTIIVRAAVLLNHHGDAEQALQYLEWAADEPPTSIGYGNLEMQAILAATAEAAEYRGKAKVFYRKMAEAWEASGKGKKVTNQVAKECPNPPPDMVFREWDLPWRTLADKALARCDYCFAIQLISQCLMRQPSIDGYIQLAECLRIVDDADRALPTLERAHRSAPDNQRARGLLIEWEPKTWGAELDQELAKRQAKEELEEKMAAKAHQVEALGIQKVVRGRKGRVYAAGYKEWWGKQEAKIRKCVRRINAKLLKVVMLEWHKDWSRKYRQRLAISLPMTTRIDQRLLAAVLTAWAESAHANVVTKKAVKRAMTPMVASTGAGAAGGAAAGTGGGGGRGSSAVFYSKSLNKLANFHKVKHRLEARNEKVLAEKMAKKDAETSAAFEKRRARAERVLSESWAKYPDQEGYDYYYNSKTQESTYDDPFAALNDPTYVDQVLMGLPDDAGTVAVGGDQSGDVAAQASTGAAQPQTDERVEAVR